MSKLEKFLRVFYALLFIIALFVFTPTIVIGGTLSVCIMVGIMVLGMEYEPKFKYESSVATYYTLLLFGSVILGVHLIALTVFLATGSI